MTNSVVVDDDEDSLELFCEILEHLGVDVLGTGKDGKEGVHAFKKHRPDVIFVDLLMPKYDGFYAIDRIFNIDANAKIVVITGDLRVGESYLLDTYDVSAVIYKPFDISTVKQVIADIF